MESALIKVEGMHCDACVRRLRAAVEKVENVEVESVAVGELQIRFDPKQVDFDDVERAVRSTGFVPHKAAVPG